MGECGRWHVQAGTLDPLIVAHDSVDTMDLNLTKTFYEDTKQDCSMGISDEKLGSTGPTSWGNSTIASMKSPIVPSSKYGLTVKGLSSDQDAARIRRRYSWHRRFARTKKPKPSTETFIRKRVSSNQFFGMATMLRPSRS